MGTKFAKRDYSPINEIDNAVTGHDKALTPSN
jgi:hypothetical protein